jgi:hypothetical protein
MSNRMYINGKDITGDSTVKLLEMSRGNMKKMWDGGILSTSFAAMVVKKVLKTFAMSFKL